MPSNLSCIGLDIDSEDELVGLVDLMISQTEPSSIDGYRRWRGDGVEVWLVVNADQSFGGLTPYFAGKSELRFRIDALITPDADFPFEVVASGWCVEPDDAGNPIDSYPLLVDLADGVAIDPKTLPRTVTLSAAAFTHQIETYADESAFQASQTDDVKFATQSLIPTGLFSPTTVDEGNSQAEDSVEPPRPTAMFTGFVRQSERRVNRLTGQSFDWLLVETLGGSFDVVAEPVGSSVVEVGSVVSGHFYLVATVRETSPL